MYKKGRDVAEIQLPLDLISALKIGNVTCVLATFSDQGIPYAAPIHFIYPVGMSSVIFTLENKGLSYINLIWQKKITLTFMAKGNMVYSVMGRAGVIKAPSEIHPDMHVIRMDTVTVYKEHSSLVKVDSGARFSPATKQLADMSDALIEELESMAEYLV